VLDFKMTEDTQKHTALKLQYSPFSTVLQAERLYGDHMFAFGHQRVRV
jgi:hypothetical protein